MFCKAVEYRKTLVVEVGGSFNVSFQGIFGDKDVVLCLYQGTGQAFEYFCELNAVQGFGMVNVGVEEAGDYLFINKDFSPEKDMLRITLVVLPKEMLEGYSCNNEIVSRYGGCGQVVMVEDRKRWMI